MGGQWGCVGCWIVSQGTYTVLTYGMMLEKMYRDSAKSFLAKQDHLHPHPGCALKTCARLRTHNPLHPPPRHIPLLPLPATKSLMVDSTNL